MKGIHVFLLVFFFCAVTLGLLGCSGGGQTRGEIRGTVSFVVDSTAPAGPTSVIVSALDDLTITIGVDTLPPRPTPSPTPPVPFVLVCNIPGQYRIKLSGADSAGNPWQAYYRSPGGVSTALPDATPIILDAMNPIRSGVNIAIPVRD